MPGKSRSAKKPTVLQTTTPCKARQVQQPQSSSDKKNEVAPLQAAQGECLVVAQYRSSGDLRFRNAVVRVSTRMKQYGGRVLGIADEVSVVEAPEGSPWLARDDWCLALMLFPSQFLARRWYEADKEWNQHDFLTPPTGVQIFSVPIRFLPNWNEKRTYLWMEFEGVRDKAAFQSCYVNPMTSLLDNYGVDHGLVFLNDADSMKVDRLKDCWVQPGSHLCLSMLNSEDQYEKMRNTDDYKRIATSIHPLCLTTSLLFTLDPHIA